jgi:hypothetical protein
VHESGAAASFDCTNLKKRRAWCKMVLLKVDSAILTVPYWHTAVQNDLNYFEIAVSEKEDCKMGCKIGCKIGLLIFYIMKSL